MWMMLLHLYVNLNANEDDDDEKDDDDDEFSLINAYICNAICIILILAVSCKKTKAQINCTDQHFWYSLDCIISSFYTVKFLNFGKAENFAVIYLKFKQRGQTLEYFVKKIQMQ